MLFTFLSPRARAETWQAPVGGKPLAFSDGRVVCAPPAADWVVAQDGHAVIPPALDSAVGAAVELKVAPSLEACATQAATLTLVATGRWPTIDQGQTTLYVDEGRVELRGRDLRGAVVHWELA